LNNEKRNKKIEMNNYFLPKFYQSSPNYTFLSNLINPLRLVAHQNIFLNKIQGFPDSFGFWLKEGKKVLVRLYHDGEKLSLLEVTDSNNIILIWGYHKDSENITYFMNDTTIYIKIEEENEEYIISANCLCVTDWNEIARIRK
jgi:hypothetical protein